MESLRNLPELQRAFGEQFVIALNKSWGLPDDKAREFLSEWNLRARIALMGINVPAATADEWVLSPDLAHWLRDEKLKAERSGTCRCPLQEMPAARPENKPIPPSDKSSLESELDRQPLAGLRMQLLLAARQKFRHLVSVFRRKTKFGRKSS